MNQRAYLSIIAFLVFILIIVFYLKNGAESQYEEQVAKVEDLKVLSDNQLEEIRSLEGSIEGYELALAVYEAKQVATKFKQRQFNITYDPEMEWAIPIDETEKKYGSLVTNSGLEKFIMQNITNFGLQFSLETQSNLVMKDISFEPGNIRTTDKISLEYNIDILIDPVDGKEDKSIANFGQLVMVQTVSGWKVEDDIQRFTGFGEVREELVSLNY